MIPNLPPKRPYDRSQRLLFHHRRPMRDLVRGFVPGTLARDLDLRTLKRLPSDYISGMMPGEYEERTGDILWKVRWRRGKERPPQDIYILVLVEIQSTCERAMALRILTYILLFYQRLTKDQPLKKNGCLPFILPIILYNGDEPWWAPLDVFDLVEVVPEGYAAHVPSMKCILIDEKRCKPADLEPLVGNVMAAIVRAEQAEGSTDLGEVVRDLSEWLSGPKDRELCRDFLAWFAKVLVPIRCPDADVPELRDLRELLSYVETDMPNWIEKAKAEGLQEGRQEGRQEGTANTVLHLFENKFGSLQEDLKARIFSADVEQLLVWVDRIPNATSLQDVFRDQEPN